MRKSGRTTRIVDEAIQTLFTKGRVYVRDHHSTLKMDRYCYDIVVRRLHSEHPGMIQYLGFFKRDHLIIIKPPKKDDGTR